MTATISPIIISSKSRIPEYLHGSALITGQNEAPQKLPLFAKSLGESQNVSAPKNILIPTYWNSKDKGAGIDLAPGNLRASYAGTGKTDMDAASVRANHPIPVKSGMFYFEVTIISKGRDGYISVGFQSASVALNRLPGWDDFSWGYHGDDGHTFCCSGTGSPYGPVFTTNDVIGCLINFMTNNVYYTKNGMLLGEF